MTERTPPRRIDLIPLMGPPGAGKSTLGNTLNRRGVATYTDLEPILVERFGQGETFARQRASVHEWIWSFIRDQLATSRLPVIMETTGIAGRDFLEEMGATHRVLFVNVATPKATCVERVQTRAKGQHVTDQDTHATAEFYDHWHTEVKPTYAFGLEVSGTDLESDVASIQRTLRTPSSARV